MRRQSSLPCAWDAGAWPGFAADFTRPQLRALQRASAYLERQRQPGFCWKPLGPQSTGICVGLPSPSFPPSSPPPSCQSLLPIFLCPSSSGPVTFPHYRLLISLLVSLGCSDASPASLWSWTLAHTFSPQHRKAPVRPEAGSQLSSAFLYPPTPSLSNLFY